MGSLERPHPGMTVQALEGSPDAAPARSRFDCDARRAAGREYRDPASDDVRCCTCEERSAEGDRGGDVVPSAAREAGVVLQGLELDLGEGVVVGHLRAAERERVTPRSASSCNARALARHRQTPRSECRVSTWGWTPCLWQVSSMRRPASAEFSRSATIQPTA